jgi:hypothetical protein
MDLFNQGADQGFPVQINPMSGFDLSNNLGDVKGLLGSSEYVCSHTHVRHTFLFDTFSLFRFGGLQLPNGAELSRK